MDLLADGTAAIIAALLAAFGSAFVRGLTGFGMAILLVPILALALSPVHAVLPTNFLSVFIGLSEIRRLLRNKSVWIIIAIVAVTTPLGLYALSPRRLPSRGSSSPSSRCRPSSRSSGGARWIITRRPPAVSLADIPGMGLPVVPYYVGRIARGADLHLRVECGLPGAACWNGTSRCSCSPPLAATDWATGCRAGPAHLAGLRGRGSRPPRWSE